MLQITDIYLERLMLLRDVGIPIAREKEKIGKLNFCVYMSACGTYACLGGWCTTHEAFRARGLTADHDGEPCYDGKHGGYALRVFFGVDTQDTLMLFGGSDMGTLSDRAAYLDKLIEERLAALDVA